jgi:hypothetical protein
MSRSLRDLVRYAVKSPPTLLINLINKRRDRYHQPVPWRGLEGQAHRGSRPKRETPQDAPIGFNLQEFHRLPFRPVPPSYAALDQVERVGQNHVPSDSQSGNRLSRLWRAQIGNLGRSRGQGERVRVGRARLKRNCKFSS